MNQAVQIPSPPESQLFSYHQMAEELHFVELWEPYEFLVLNIVL